MLGGGLELAGEFEIRIGLWLLGGGLVRGEPLSDGGLAYALVGDAEGDGDRAQVVDVRHPVELAGRDVVEDGSGGTALRFGIHSARLELPVGDAFGERVIDHVAQRGRLLRHERAPSIGLWGHIVHVSRRRCETNGWK